MSPLCVYLCEFFFPFEQHKHQHLSDTHFFMYDLVGCWLSMTKAVTVFSTTDLYRFILDYDSSFDHGR